MRKQRVLLAVDRPAALAGEAVVLALSNRLERLTHQAHDVELVEQDRLAPVAAAEPDRSLAHHVADDHAVRVTLADGQLVDTDDPRSRGADTAQLLAQVLLAELLDRVPVERQLLGNQLDSTGATATTPIEREALGVERIVRQETNRSRFTLGSPRLISRWRQL